MSLLNLADDGDWLSPRAMAARLAGLTAETEIAADYYGVGGPVTALETAVATLFGKEAAVMHPTGTLANMLALRELATGLRGPRLVVQRDSHVFNDAGDNFTHSAGVTMVPLVSQGPSFSPDQLRAEIRRTASARVPATVAGVMIESPSRRHANRMFDSEAMAEIIALCREEGIPLILDGARIFIEAAWTGRSPAEIAAPFDYIYLSLYKYLDAPFGAVMAGPAAALAYQHHERRRFGGGLFQMWPAALLALHALSRQEEVWPQVRAAGDTVMATLRKDGIALTRHDDDTNVFRIAVGNRAADVTARAEVHQVKLPPIAGGICPIKMNESWLQRPAGDIAGTLLDIFAPTARV